jgi:hypothetical protein
MNNRVGVFFGQGRQFISDTRQQVSNTGFS